MELKYQQYHLIDLQIEFNDNFSFLTKLAKASGALIPYVELYNEAMRGKIDIFNGYVFCPEESLQSVCNQLDHNTKFQYHEVGMITKDEIETMMDNFYGAHSGGIEVDSRVKVVVGEYKNVRGYVKEIKGNDTVVEYTLLDERRIIKLPITAIESEEEKSEADLGFVNYMENPETRIAVIVDGERLVWKSLNGLYRTYYRKGDKRFVGIVFGVYYTLLKIKILFPEAEIYFALGGDMNLEEIPKRSREDVEYNIRWVLDLVKAVGFNTVYTPASIDSIVLMLMEELEKVDKYDEVYVYTDSPAFVSYQSDTITIKPFTGKGFNKAGNMELQKEDIGNDIKSFVIKKKEFDEAGLKELLYEMEMYQEIEMFTRIKNQFQGIWP